MESTVRLLPDSTGKKVRTVEVTTSQGVVEQQVVVLANEHGDLEPTSEARAAFGALRVANPLTLFDSKLLYDKQPLVWSEALVGAGAATHDPASAHVSMAVSANADSVIRQTKMRFNYQSGKSQLVMLTGLFSKQTGVRKRAGYFDGSNGVFLEVAGTAVSANIMKGGVVAETAAQAAWNLDALNGSGPSGITLDFAAVQIIVVDFQWLGAGRVRVGFIVGGRVVYCHAFDHTNVSGFVTTYMASPNLPVRYEVLSTGGAGSALQICSTVISEGGSTENGYTYSAGALVPVTLPASGRVVLAAVRLKSDRESASVLVTYVELLLTTAGAARWSLVLNPTVGGTALSWAGVDDTSVEVAIGVANNIATGGFVLDAGYSSAQVRQASRPGLSTLRLGMDLAGAQDVIAIVAENVANTPNVVGQLGLRELV